MFGVLHVGGDVRDPIACRTSLSRTREDLLARTGSRYAPASVCDGLEGIERAPGPCAFVGQPSEVTAMRRAASVRQMLAAKIGIAISFFCAGSPSRLGTKQFLRANGVDPEDVGQIRYRGNGWPGNFSVTLKGGNAVVLERSYAESWAALQRYRPFSTHLCPDGTGEDADISCGDAWHREVGKFQPGRSLILVRTDRGKQLVREAVSAGYLTVFRSSPENVLNSQANLLQKRGAIWGRVATLRLLGIPAPRLKGFALFRNWLALSLGEKIRSVLGTLRRVLQRRYFVPQTRGL